MSDFEDPTYLLLALAERFERHAERNGQYLQHQSRDTALQLIASSEAWRAAANILRHTALTDTKSSFKITTRNPRSPRKAIPKCPKPKSPQSLAMKTATLLTQQLAALAKKLAFANPSRLLPWSARSRRT
jgi:hypothetical protein